MRGDSRQRGGREMANKEVRGDGRQRSEGRWQTKRWREMVDKEVEGDGRQRGGRRL